MRQQHNIPNQSPEQVLASCEQLFGCLSSSLQILENQLTDIVPKIQDPSLEARRAAAILKALPAGVVIIDGAGKVIQCNPAAEDLLGIPLLGEFWRTIIDRAFAPRADDGHDVSLVDGRIVNISTSPLGDVPGQLVLVTEVTKTRQLQAAVSRNERLVAMGHMAANMAHQIRTPLSAALLYASQLKSTRLSATQLARVSERISSSILHLEHLVNDMLMYANGGTAGEDVFALDEFVEALVQQIQSQLEGTQITFHLDQTVTAASLKANRNMLLSCMLNLVNNAIEAMAGDGVLTLHIAAASAGGVDLMVEDSGPGISAEHQARLFEPFFTTRASGTGLGLAVVRLIARAHQGDAWFRSTPGLGSTFAMRLPVLKSRRAADGERQLAAMPAAMAVAR